MLAEGVAEEIEEGAAEEGYEGTGAEESPLSEGRKGDVSDGLDQVVE